MTFISWAVILEDDMFVVTASLKAWLEENCDVKNDASDDELQKAVANAFATGKLSGELYAKLTETDEDKAAGEGTALMKDVLVALKGLKDAFSAGNASSTKEPDKEPESKDDEPDGTKDSEPAKKAVPTRFEKMIFAAAGNSLLLDSDDGEEKSLTTRVKEAAEQYVDTKAAMLYPETVTKSNGVTRRHVLAGRPMMDFNYEKTPGRQMNELSDLDKAVSGSYAKFLASTAQMKGSRTFGFQQLPQHDKELLCYAMQKMQWNGSSNAHESDYADIRNRNLTEVEAKALIDDATSGGLEAAPIVFDDQVIQTPLLFGELFPLVNQIPLDRGRRVEGVATGTVTGSWGGVDDSAITLFNTASYVSAFDTTIFRWEGAIRIGLDFLSDTPIDFGAHITAQYGERLLEDLDDVIADGNGSTQPEGAMQKSGATSVTFSSTTSIGNYESLMFSVNKNERRPNVAGSIVFCGNETSYQRARALPVGASDARRLGGGLGTIGGVGDYLNWLWMGHPYKINETLANTEIFYAVLARYRMYRRRGLVMRSSTEGDTLIRNNEMLLVAMARYGGQFERGAVVGRTTDAPA